MNRREFIKTSSGIVASSLLCSKSLLADKNSKTSELGICLYSLKNHLEASRKTKIRDQFLTEPLVFIGHCRKYGAAGVQLPLGIRSEADCSSIRKKAEQYNMFIEGIVNLPNQNNLDTFVSQLQTIKSCGADTARIVTMPGRRYEQFKTYSEFKTRLEYSEKIIGKIEPLASKHGVRLAIENHKDRTLTEFQQLLDKYQSEYIGVCFDTGNNFALMEDPVEVAKGLASRIFTVHLKDQALCRYKDGFLMADVPFGQGVIDLKQIAKIIKDANPVARFNLEQIIRDPIKIPVLTDQYWATLPEVPAKNLAWILKTVNNQNSYERCIPISPKKLQERCELEEKAINKSFAYAKEIL